MDASDDEQRREFGAGCAMLCASEFAASAAPDWFDDKYWGAAAQPVVEGGRGAAWFIRRDEGDWVLRHYRRGGLMARFSRDRYVWAGEAAVRSVAEFRLLQRLHELQLPVPRPIAAWYRRRGLGYGAALIVERIAGARPMTVLLEGGERAAWAQIGATIARFHGHGVEHADLNANNILLAGGEVWLIDFDRGRLHAGDGSGSWRQANLDRLARSLRKLGGDAADAPWRSGYAALCDAYAAEMAR